MARPPPTETKPWKSRRLRYGASDAHAAPMRSDERASKVDATVALALFASAGALAVAATFEAGLTALFAAFVLLRARRVFLAVGCAFVFCACASRASDRVRAFEREHAQAAEGRWPSRCALVGEVVSSSTRLGGAVRFDVEKRMIASSREGFGPADRSRSSWPGVPRSTS